MARISTQAPSDGLAAGRDYPSTYRQFVQMFPDDDACLRYLVGLRWPKGFRCTGCGRRGEPWRASRHRLVCPGCRRQGRALTGTVFDKTRTPLTTWFEAAWHVTTAKNGMSALTLARTVGTNYRVAWAILHRFRVAMVRLERPLLEGEVEVDETLVGGVHRGGKRGRGADRSVVAIAVELRRPKGFGRIRMRHVPDASADSLVPFVRESVVAGSRILTDAWRSYNDLSKWGYAHKSSVLATSGAPAHAVMPGVHRVASLLKRWILGTHQGSVDPAYLQGYLEEFTFRFNRRSSKSRGLVFRRLMEQCVRTGPVREAAIVARARDHNP